MNQRINESINKQINVSTTFTGNFRTLIYVVLKISVLEHAKLN